MRIRHGDFELKTPDDELRIRAGVRKLLDDDVSFLVFLVFVFIL